MEQGRGLAVKDIAGVAGEKNAVKLVYSKGKRAHPPTPFGIKFKWAHLKLRQKKCRKYQFGVWALCYFT